MAVFEIGDKVAAIDEAISGVVVSIAGPQVTITDSHGFPLTFEARELVKIESDITVTHNEVAQVKKEKELSWPKRARAKKAKQRNLPQLEVDLHIHQLVESTKGLDSYAMLNLQLETAERQLEFAMRKRIQKVVFIHGVGEGILKEELRYLFRRYDNVKYYDADYQKYGQGATEVYIYQNPKGS